MAIVSGASQVLIKLILEALDATHLFLSRFLPTTLQGENLAQLILTCCTPFKHLT